MTSNQNKILKDIRKVGKVKFFLDSARACLKFKKDDVSDLTISILPVHGPFEYCLVRFNLKFDAYQVEKPTVKCLTKIFHPNISSSGSVCYSMFGSDWSQNFGLMDYINGLVHDDPLNSSCVIKDRSRYRNAVQNAASGKLNDGNYDKCKIYVNIEDSQVLSQCIIILMTFADRVEFIKELTEKVTSFFRTLSLDHRNNKKICDEAFTTLKKCEKKVLEVVEEANSAIDVKGFAEFDPKKLSEIEMKFLSILELLREFQSLERKYSLLIVDLEKRFDKRYSRRPFIHEHVQRVRSSFENPLKLFRQAVDIHLPTLMQNFNKKNSSSLLSSLKRFFENCIRVFAEETKNYSYLCRVYERFRGKKKGPEFFERFEKNEFLALFEISSQMYSKLDLAITVSKNLGSEVLIIDDDVTNQQKSVELNECIKLLSDVRDNAEKILKIEHGHQLICDRINSKEFNFKDVIQAYINQGVCTYKYSGRKYVLQKYEFCCDCGISCCVVCASKCHDKHRLSGERRGRFRCDCATKPKCKLKENEFDEAALEILNVKKEKFEGKREEIELLLEELHTLIKKEDKMKINVLEKKIEGACKV